jgi:hypothetical protein
MLIRLPQDLGVAGLGLFDVGRRGAASYNAGSDADNDESVAHCRPLSAKSQAYI